VEIASTKGQDHLLAISGRTNLPEAVTDVIVDRGELSNDLALATVDDHVGDGFREVCPARNGQQMILPFCACNLHEIAGPKAAGGGQHAAGHRDFVIPREVLNDFERCVVDGRQTRAEFGPGPALDAGNKKTQHVVEDLDLILAEAFPAMQEKICHLPKGRDAFLR